MRIIIILWLVTSFSVFAQDVKIYGDDSERPRIYLSKEGKSSGFLVDILNFIQRESDLEISIELLPWSRSYKNALAGKGGIVGISKSIERESFFYFTDEIYREDVLLVGLKREEVSFSGLNSLDGKVVGITRSGYYGSEFTKKVSSKKVQVIELNNTSQRLGMLLKGRVDWIIVGSGQKGLESALRDNSILGKDLLFVAPKSLLVDENYIGFSKSAENLKIVNKINFVLRSTKGQIFLKSYIRK